MVQACRCKSVKDLEIARMSWINFVGPKHNHKCPCKTEREGRYREDGNVTEAEKDLSLEMKEGFLR